MNKEDLAKALNTITANEYLTRCQLLALLSITSDFYYMYDMLSCFSDWHITDKGFTAKDATGAIVQFNDRTNKDMTFYKSGFIVM